MLNISTQLHVVSSGGKKRALHTIKEHFHFHLTFYNPGKHTCLFEL